MNNSSQQSPHLYSWEVRNNHVANLFINGDNDFKELIENIKRFELSYGGPKLAYDMEWKVRIFVNLVLMQAFKS